MITTDKNRVCVNSVWIDVEFCDPESEKLYVKSNYCLGMFYCCEAKIYLNNRMNASFLKTTLIHEITHAVISYTQIEGRKESYTEENVCEMMGMFATQISVAAKEIMSCIVFNPNPTKNPDQKIIMSFQEDE